MESTGECPPQWAKCEICEHRAYVTEDAPETVCSFYKEGIPGKDWDKIVFQSYPEGSCIGTWLSSDFETKNVLRLIFLDDHESIKTKNQSVGHFERGEDSDFILLAVEDHFTVKLWPPVSIFNANVILGYQDVSCRMSKEGTW